MILETIEHILFYLLAFMVFYVFILGISSLFKPRKLVPKKKKLNRIAVLFPAYKEDRVIFNSVTSFLNQAYPKDLYRVVVISDHMEDKTNDALCSLPVDLLKATYSNSSKAKALQLAMSHLEGNPLDIIVVLDADNIVDTDFLYCINDAYNANSLAIQAHRIAKNRNTDIALLDAVSEEINNSFFRRGNVNLGLSASLSGSGMAFDYLLFCKYVPLLKTAGEDRELESLLLKDRVYVDYLENVFIYDEKTQNLKNFKNQRKRWLAVQFGTLSASFKYFPQELTKGNIDYCNKILQWMLLPRSVLLMLLPLLSLVVMVIDVPSSFRWWVITFVFYLSVIIAIPHYLVGVPLIKAVIKIPLMVGMMCANFFKIKEGNKTFIHTEHDAE